MLFCFVVDLASTQFSFIVDNWIELRCSCYCLLPASRIGDDFYVQITKSTKETFCTEGYKNQINQLATLILHLLYLLLKSQFDRVDHPNTWKGICDCVYVCVLWVGLG